MERKQYVAIGVAACCPPVTSVSRICEPVIDYSFNIQDRLSLKCGYWFRSIAS